MAQFLMAKFLSQALEWKARFPAAQFYDGLRYEPFVYEKARLIFPEYSKLYPDNKQFTEKVAKDLRNRDSALLKITDPEVVTAEHEAQDRRFVTEAQLEQQQAAQIAPEQASPPFSLTPAATGARLTPIPAITNLPAQEKGESVETMEAAQEETRQQQASAPPQTGTAQPSPQTQTRPKFTLPKMPLAFTSAGKNFGSATQRLIGTNLGRIGRSLGEIAGGVGRGIGAPMLNSAYSGMKKIGPHGLDAFERLYNISGPKFEGAGSTKLKGLGTGKKVALAFSLFTLLFGITAIFSAISQPPTTSEASPNQTPTNGLDFTLPLRDPSIIPQNIRPAILQRWPNAQIDNWQIIIDQAIAHGWNPAVLLTLWIEESGAQGEANYTDPLGCDVTKPSTDIQVSLNCFFNSFDNKFTNDQFGQFLLTYSAPNDPVPFQTNPYFPKNFKDWYSRLVPSDHPGALTLISTQTTQTAEALGCPTVGTITNPYGYNIPGQPNDIDYYGCGGLPSCHSGIDIAWGRGTSVSATFDAAVTTVSSDNIKGKYVTISNSQTGYSATFEHLDSQIVSVGESVKRGQVIGTMGSTGAAGGVHLHYRLERNSKVINPFRYLGSSGLIAATSLTQSDEIGANNYQDKVESLNWGQCNQVP